MEMGKENRTYMRIPTRLRAHARRIDSADSQPLFRGIATQTETTRPSKVTGVPENLTTLLSEINSKLDLLVSSMNRELLLKDFPIQLEIVEISGAGVRFVNDGSVAINDNLELIIILSHFPLRLAGVSGTVQREVEKEDKRFYAFNFKHIRDHDREAIVQYVFQEQREIIRESKNEY
ncbi:MAG: PilZ domain-containing protein [Desulfovibrionales bacterium]